MISVKLLQNASNAFYILAKKHEKNVGSNSPKLTGCKGEPVSQQIRREFKVQKTPSGLACSENVTVFSRKIVVIKGEFRILHSKVESCWCRKQQTTDQLKQNESVIR